ncbi:MAG TPA: hypothetical protein VKT80_12550, partial [Chloroflexota bacterium]|nr:hypothetical protein [Chloroflexota bacterium]
LALGLPPGQAQGSLRISLGHHNTNEEIDRLLATLPPTVEALRQTEVSADLAPGNLNEPR